MKQKNKYKKIAILKIQILIPLKKHNLQFSHQVCTLCGGPSSSITPPLVSDYYNLKVVLKFRQWKNDLKLIWEDIVKISVIKGLSKDKNGEK